MRYLIVIIVILWGAPSLWAQPPDPAKLENLTEKQKQAEAQAKALTERQKKILADIDKLQSDLVSTSGKARGYERAETQARAQLQALSSQEQQLSGDILSHRAALADMLAALQRIDNSPPPALLVHPQNATDAARAAHLLAYLTGELHTRSETLQEQLVKLQALRKEMKAKRTEIANHASEVNTRLGRIKTIISHKSELSNKLDKDRKTKISEAERLAKQAKDLRDLIAKFEENAETIVPRLKPKRRAVDSTPRLKPKAGRNTPPAYIPPLFLPSANMRFADARGQLPLPVFGRLSRSFGARMAGGGTAKGITLKTAKKAQVIAPFTGRVEFSGPFNDDHLVILNVGDGYFIVLTGLGETFTKPGTRVKAGEPLGLMPNTGTSSPELFMELRKNRRSINPKPWIGAALAKSR